MSNYPFRKRGLFAKITRMNEIQSLLSHSAEIEAQIDYTFKNRELLVLAFVHRSFANENREIDIHNERLEFLGDSVLGLLIAEYLYRILPNNPEGDLSHLRSRLVEASSCVIYVQKLGVAQYLLLGRGERQSATGKGRDSILADFFEALIGAIYLDGSLSAAHDFLFKHFSTEFEDIVRKPLRNSKALLQDYCQKKYQKPPSYRVSQESGPDHCKTFAISVYIQDKEVGHGEGTSKKEAEQAAAANALLNIDMSL